MSTGAKAGIFFICTAMLIAMCFGFLDYQKVETHAVVTDKYVAASALGHQCNYVKVKAEDYEDIVVVDGFVYGNIDKGDLVTITETTYLYGLLTDKSLVTD